MISLLTYNTSLYFLFLFSKMKVLIACNEETFSNPYVKTLAQGIADHGVDISCSLHDFWNDWKNYDIIHIQWPNILVKGLNNVATLRLHLLEIKDAGIPIVVTCHNLHPHCSKNVMLQESYDIVYDLVDNFIHMGEYSYKLFVKLYPHAHHFIIPHHIYDHLYNNFPTRAEACRYLKLNPNIRYILCFGIFRNDEERNIAYIAATMMKSRGYIILAPGFARFKWRVRIWNSIRKYIEYIRYKVKYRGISFSHNFIPDEDLPYYYSAADIALIHRCDILNSGNLPMALMMGKVTVGPNVGNVGCVLRETGNPTFEVNDLKTLVSAIELAARLVENGKGELNKRYAYEHYTTNAIAKRHCLLYDEIINNNQ